MAVDQMGLDKSRCVIVEDSGIGLKSAIAAGVKCIVTKSSYTAGEDFTGADLVVDELGDDPATGVTLATLAGLIGGEAPAPAAVVAPSVPAAPTPVTPPFPAPAPVQPAPAPQASPPAPKERKKGLDVYLPDWT